MSTVNKHAHLNPNDPAYYAPRRLRERPELQRSAPREVSSGHSMPQASAPASFGAALEEAFPKYLQRSFNAEPIPEPLALARELDRHNAFIGIARRFVIIVGISALVALAFVIMVPASRDSAQLSDNAASSSSGILQSIGSIFSASAQRDDDAKPALSSLQPTPALASEPVATREPSDGALLQQFLQWRQSPDPAVPSQSQ